MRRALRLYGRTYGVRAILWMQGETDNEAFSDPSWNVEETVTNKDLSPTSYIRRLSSSEQYRDELLQVVQESRIALGTTVPWVVARASFRNNTALSLITTGQNLATNTANQIDNKIFPGPETDNITGPTKRRVSTDIIVLDPNNPAVNDIYGAEPTHFKDAGLSEVAQSWATALFDANTGVLRNAAGPATVAAMGSQARPLTLSSDGNTFTAPQGTAYSWLAEVGGSANPNSPVSTQQSIGANIPTSPPCPTCSPGSSNVGSQGARRVLVQDSQGRLIVTQSVPYPYYEVDDTPQPTTCAAPASGSCYTIKVQKTDLMLQTVNGGASIQQLAANNQPNQIWKIEDTGNSRYRFTIQDGTNRVVQTTTGTNGNYLALGNYTGDDKQRWGIGAQNGFYRVFTSNNTTWDLLDFGNQATLQLYGNTGEPFYTYRSFCFTPATCPTTTCNLNVSASNTNPNAQCGQSAQLNFNCSGADCNGATFTWSGNGINQTLSAGQSLGTGALNTNGALTYTLTATKGSCQQQVQTTVTVSGCVTTPPTGSCYEAESGSRSAGTDVQPSGNASGGQYVGGFDGASRYVDFTVNATSAGSYPLTFYYASGEAGGYIDYAINGGSVLRFDNNGNGIPPTGGWNTFAASSAVTIALNAGSNTIRVQGGFRFTLDKICAGNTPPPPPPGFALNAPSLNCASGNVTLSVVNSNGNPVEYQTIGLRGWGTGNVLTVPAHQLNGTDFTFQARQSGNGEVSRLFRVACGGSRAVAEVSEPDSDADTGLVISPNPPSGRVSVRFRLAAGERGSLSVQSLTGAVLQSRLVVGTGAAQTEVLDMEREPSGLYLIRVSGRATSDGGGRNQTGRVLLMR